MLETQKLPQLNETWQSTLGWQPNEKQQEQFQRLYQAILAGNRQFNLTRITAPDEFWEKHLWDSVAGLVGLDLETLSKQRLTMIDIGTGAGFPGIAIAIAQPQWQVTLLDATRKKIRFLDTLINDLALENVTTLTGRAEAVGQQSHRETYELASVRAVGSASVCAEYAVPLLKTGGLAILYRGQWHDEESAVTLAADELGSTIESVRQLTTPLSHSIRHCVYLRKRSPTPASYPRAVGIPTQQPL